MNPLHSFAFVAALIATPLVAACDPSTLDPIGKSTTSTSGSGGASGGTTTGTATTTTTGAGGSMGSACAPACGEGAVCVEGSCHALLALDTTDAMNPEACVIALDATQVYWRTAELRRVPKAGGTATLLDPATPSPGGLVVGDTYLYWTNAGLLRADKASPGTPGTGVGAPYADEGGSPSRLVGDASTLYYLDSGAIYLADTVSPPAPQDPPTLFSAAWSSLDTPIALDADNLYLWTEGGSVLTRVRRDLASSKDLASRGNSHIDASCGLSIDASGVYFSTAPSPGQGGLVRRVDPATGTDTVIVDASLGANGVFALDADDVYFQTPSGVMKQPKAGGAAIAVSAFSPPSPFPTCLAIDAQYVYWVDGVTLMRFTK